MGQFGEKSEAPKQAQLRAKVIEAEPTWAGLGESPPVTLSAWMAREMDRRRAERLRNVKSDGWAIAKHVASDAIGAMTLQALDGNVAQARAFMGRLLEKRGGGRGRRAEGPSDKKLSARTVRNVLTLVRVALGRAVEEGHMRGNPFMLVHVPKAATRVHTDESWTILEEEQQRRLLEAIKPGNSRERILDAMVRVALGTGIRKGELLALTWNDVVLSPVPMLVIRRGTPIRRSHEESSRGPTKGGKPRRVPLFGIALGAMHSWRAFCQHRVELGRLAVFEDPSTRLRMRGAGFVHFDIGVEGQDDGAIAHGIDGEKIGHERVERSSSSVLIGVDDERHGARLQASDEKPHANDGSAPVFPGRGGDFRVKVPVAEFVEAQRRAGFERIADWHDLRHSCATSLLEGWWGRRWSLEEVQMMLGHSSRTTTECYVHMRGALAFRAASEMPRSAEVLSQAQKRLNWDE